MLKHDEIVEVLKRAEPSLRARGVKHAALFGSVARGENGPDSDVDILVDLDANVVRTIYDYAGVKRYIAGLLGTNIDVVNREGLRLHVRPSVIADSIDVF